MQDQTDWDFGLKPGEAHWNGYLLLEKELEDYERERNAISIKNGNRNLKFMGVVVFLIVVLIIILLTKL